MEDHIETIQRKADDLSRLKELMEGALTDLHQVLADVAKDAADARARANGQAELPLPDGAAAAAAPVPRRATLLGYLDDLEDGLERGDAERATRAARSLRTAIEDI